MRGVDTVRGVKVVASRTLGGGSVSDVRLVELADGREVVVKSRGRGPRGILEAEADGLRRLAEVKGLRVPTVEHVDEDMLVLEWLGAGRPARGFDERLGRGLAMLHRQGTGKAFGLDADNFCGLTPQKNSPFVPQGEGEDRWPRFYFDYRLAYQLELLERRGRATGELRRGLARLGDRIETLLAAPKEPPRLIHGDLWRGNVVVTASGEPALIDPAVYYGHREAELAMTRLFGGFSQSFYDAYQEISPLAPGWREREPLYRLYHLLNHLNLFGGSYYGEVMEILRRY